MFKEELLKKALKLYAGEHVLNRVLKYGESALKLKGEAKYLTIYYQEINSFTHLSEAPSHEDVFSLYNEYLWSMARIIMNNNGIILDYFGDLIVSIWGLDEHNNHASNACKCALECLRNSNSLQEKFSIKGIPNFVINVGINTGEVYVGNFGYDERICFSVMGDNVSLASRLMGANKQYRTQIILSQYTKEQLDGSFSIRELDEVKINGKNNPLKLYSLELL